MHVRCARCRVQRPTHTAPGSFGFTTTGGLDPATFSLSDDGTRDFGGTVQAGSYSVTETVSVTLENGRRFKIIVLVCGDSDNAL